MKKAQSNTIYTEKIKPFTVALILAGGQATRMKGKDKGLVLFSQKPLIEHVINHISSQTHSIIISANRNIDRYQQYGYPVISDLPDYTQMGPLSGLISFAENHIKDYQYVLLTPCDTPFLPPNLATTLYNDLILHKECHACYARTTDGLHPSICLIETKFLHNLKTHLSSGQRKLRCWLDTCPASTVMFDNNLAFININDKKTLKIQENQSPPTF